MGNLTDTFVIASQASCFLTQTIFPFFALKCNLFLSLLRIRVCPRARACVNIFIMSVSVSQSVTLSVSHYHLRVELSEPMLKLARERFAKDKLVKVVKHDLNVPIPTAQLGSFDLIISGLAIHHVTHERKKQLYQEIFNLLNHKGVFCNLEHVASPTESLHRKFLTAVGLTTITDDPSNKLLDVETQLRWLRKIGFQDVDCMWKWREVAVLVGLKP